MCPWVSWSSGAQCSVLSVIVSAFSELYPKYFNIWWLGSLQRPPPNSGKCFSQTPPVTVNSLFSGGLKPGFRQLRNSSKLSFQSAFSSESSMRASTHRLLEDTITHTYKGLIEVCPHSPGQTHDRNEECLEQFNCSGVYPGVCCHRRPSVMFAQAR